MPYRLTPFIVALLLAAAPTVPAQTPLPTAAVDEGFAPDRLARLEAFLRDATAPGGYLGAVMLVTRHGRVVEWQAFGAQDLARRVPMRRDAIFRIYSMTKTAATIGALVLMEEGRLGLDDPVEKFLPEFRGQQVMSGGTADRPQLRVPARPVTIRHLMTHTAGLATGGQGREKASQLFERGEPSRATDLADFARRVARAPLADDPGTRFNYDGVGLEVLSRVVEVVARQPLDAFLRTRIFEPLRMRDTGFEVPAGERARVVDLTVMDDAGALVRAPTRSAVEPGARLNTYFSGAGGLYSTAADWARLCQMLLDGGTLDGVTILGRKTVELMMRNHLDGLTPPTTSFSPAEGFGLGGGVVLDAARRGRLGSDGSFFWTGAASTTFTIDPREQMVTILLMQHLPRDGTAGPDLPRLATPFYNLVYQALVDPPRPP